VRQLATRWQHVAEKGMKDRIVLLCSSPFRLLPLSTGFQKQLPLFVVDGSFVFLSLGWDLQHFQTLYIVANCYQLSLRCGELVLHQLQRFAMRPGIGAKGSILTRFIKPKQVIPDSEEAKHRSIVTIEGWYSDDKGRVYYRFRYHGPSGGSVMHGSARYVKIEEEGPESGFFIGQAPKLQTKPKEPTIPWRKSRARELLYEDLRKGLIDEDHSDMDVYAMRPEYAAYDWDLFPGRLRYLKKSIHYNQERAEIDQDAFDQFVSNNPVSYFSKKGYIQWQNSDAQNLARQDILNESFTGSGKYRRLYNSRVEYYLEFPFEAFKHKIRQEIRTAKYKHTLKKRGKAYGDPKKWPK
jgi:hypothetical protein